MSLEYCQSKAKEELNQIIELQQKNLPHNVPQELRKKEGFVSVSHTLDILEQMHTVCPHIIAKDQDTVVAYALCMHSMFANEIDLLKPMFVKIEKSFPNDKSYIVMGQICIDKAYRGKGVFRKLYKTMQQFVFPDFKAIITEVDATNTRSLSAHYAIGFTDLTTYVSNGQEWKLIVLE